MCFRRVSGSFLGKERDWLGQALGAKDGGERRVTKKGKGQQRSKLGQGSQARQSTCRRGHGLVLVQ